MVEKSTEIDKATDMLQALSLAKRIAPKREYFAIAPMVDVSDRHFRHFMRLLSKHCYLYTEMLNEHAILYSKKREQLLTFDASQHPVVCQLGGNDPDKMA